MKVRQCRKWTSWETSPIIELNPDDFRNLSIPFEGDTEAEFIKYLSEYSYEFENIEDEFNEELYLRVMSFIQPGNYAEWEEYYNSLHKHEESWFEVGEENSDYSKNGFFETKITTDDL